MLPFQNCQISASKTQISSDLADEAVILSLKSGTYYGLNEVGAKVWQLIQQPQTLSSIREALLSEYDINVESCDRDLIELLTALKAAELIEVSHATTA